MKTVLRNPRTSSPSLLECLTAHTLVNLCFTSDARVPLEAQGFGRIHHRILFFVNQRPGITVNELISVMRVSHQNLRGSMRQLIDQGYLLSKVGEEDRRQKCTFTSAKGLELIERLSHTQFSRIQKAFAAAGPEAVKAFLNVHRLLMDADDVQWMNEAAELRADQ